MGGFDWVGAGAFLVSLGTFIAAIGAMVLSFRAAAKIDKQAVEFVEVKQTIGLLEKNTNSIKDALVATTDRMARAEGKAEGKVEGKAEGKAEGK